MALRDIVLDSDPMLRFKSRPVEKFDQKLSKLLDDMYQTMVHNNGCGLAAPQVGILRRIAVVEADNVFIEMINPKIIRSEGEQIGQEACLSVKDKSCFVNRPYVIEIEYFDRLGKKQTKKVEGFAARACCHEIDHLDGILFYDKECQAPADEPFED